MKISFLKGLSFDEFIKDKAQLKTDTDVLVISYGVLDTVRSELEIKGDTEIIMNLANLSRELNCVIFAGIDFDLYGEMRKSVVVCDSGKLCGISDTIYCADTFTCSDVINIYETTRGKIGIIVDSDVYHAEIAHALKLYGAQMLVCVVSSDMTENIYNHIMCASYDRGITVICATNDYGIAGGQKCELIREIDKPFCSQNIEIVNEIGIESKTAIYKTIYKKLLE